MLQQGMQSVQQLSNYLESQRQFDKQLEASYFQKLNDQLIAASPDKSLKSAVQQFPGVYTTMLTRIGGVPDTEAGKLVDQLTNSPYNEDELASYYNRVLMNYGSGQNPLEPFKEMEKKTPEMQQNVSMETPIQYGPPAPTEAQRAESNIGTQVPPAAPVQTEPVSPLLKPPAQTNIPVGQQSETDVIKQAALKNETPEQRQARLEIEAKTNEKRGAPPSETATVAEADGFWKWLQDEKASGNLKGLSMYSFGPDTPQATTILKAKLLDDNRELFKKYKAEGKKSTAATVPSEPVTPIASQTAKAASNIIATMGDVSAKELPARKELVNMTNKLSKEITAKTAEEARSNPELLAQHIKMATDAINDPNVIKYFALRQNAPSVLGATMEEQAAKSPASSMKEQLSLQKSLIELEHAGVSLQQAYVELEKAGISSKTEQGKAVAATLTAQYLLNGGIPTEYVPLLRDYEDQYNALEKMKEGKSGTELATLVSRQKAIMDSRNKLLQSCSDAAKKMGGGSGTAMAGILDYTIKNVPTGLFGLGTPKPELQVPIGGTQGASTQTTSTTGSSPTMQKPTITPQEQNLTAKYGLQ
jgi:hypothetical protein